MAAALVRLACPGNIVPSWTKPHRDRPALSLAFVPPERCLVGFPGLASARVRVHSAPVGSDFVTLLDATLEHLTDLRSRGVAFVDVSQATLAALAVPLGQPALRSRSASAPAAPSRVVSPQGPIPASTASPVSPAPQFPPLPPPLPASERSAALAQLCSTALACQLCPHLVQSRSQVVFGVGDPLASVMFVGEAPGADEDRQGEPFVGRAGQLLTRIIQAMGLSRETVYIANILKCRPDMPPGSRGNRPPRPEEMAACRPYLARQIEIIQPRVLVALGGSAVQGLLERTTPLGAVRSRWQDYRGIPVMPTFHPSYLLRCEDGPDRGHGEKRKAWEDMLKVLERLEMPITEKMRGYFLKPA